MAGSGTGVRRRARVRVGAVLAAIAAIGLGACARDGRTLREPGPGQGESIAVVTTSAAPTDADATEEAALAPFAVSAGWIDGGAMDPRHTCDGDGTAPAVAFDRVPAGTTNLAVVLVDVGDGGRPLWAVDGIDPTTAATREGIDPAYEPPCPPPGALREYLLQGFALGEAIEFRPAPGSPDDLALFVEAIRAAAFDSAETRAYVQRA